MRSHICLRKIAFPFCYKQTIIITSLTLLVILIYLMKTLKSHVVNRYDIEIKQNHHQKHWPEVNLQVLGSSFLSIVNNILANAKLSGNEVTSFCTSLHAQIDKNELSTGLTTVCSILVRLTAEHCLWFWTSHAWQISEKGLLKNKKYIFNLAKTSTKINKLYYNLQLFVFKNPALNSFSY